MSSSPLDRGRVRGMLVWGTGISAVTRIGQVLLSILLVRLLSPEVYGQYGVVASVLVFVQAFSMQRFMEHSFHVTDDAEVGYGRHLAFGMLGHAVLFLATNAVALGLAATETYRPVAPFIHVASLAILVNVPRIFHVSYLQRELDWRRIRFLQLSGLGAAASVSLTLALLGGGVYALVAQSLVMPLPFVVDLLVGHRHRLRLDFDWHGFREPWRFGLLRTASAIVVTGRTLTESFLFTALSGFADYGVFGRAQGLARLGTSFFTDQAGTVAYPVLAKLEQGGEPLRRAAGLMLRLVVWTSLPLALAIVSAPTAFVALVYGPTWLAVAGLLPPILPAVVALLLIQGMSAIALTSLGPVAVFAIDLLLLVVVVLGLLLVLPQGTFAYTAWLAVGFAAAAVLLLVRLVHRGALAVAALARTILVASLTVAIGLGVLRPLSGALLDYVGPPLALAAGAAGNLLVLTLLVRLCDAQGLRSALTFLPAGPTLSRVLLLPAR